MVKNEDLIVGFKFTLGGIDCTIKKAKPEGKYVSYTEDGGTGAAMMDKELLLRKLNRSV